MHFVTVIQEEIRWWQLPYIKDKIMVNSRIGRKKNLPRLILLETGNNSHYEAFKF